MTEQQADDMKIMLHLLEDGAESSFMTPVQRLKWATFTAGAGSCGAESFLNMRRRRVLTRRGPILRRARVDITAETIGNFKTKE